jgi:hypothetical protein
VYRDGNSSRFDREKKEREKKKKTLLFNNKRSSPSGLSRFFYYYYTFSLSLIFFCSIFYDYHHFLFVFSGESSRLAGYFIFDHFFPRNGFRRFFVNGCRFFAPTIKDETGEF